MQLLVPVLGATLYVSDDTFDGVMKRRGVRVRRVRDLALLLVLKCRYGYGGTLRLNLSVH